MRENTNTAYYPCALTIAGSDSGGGAGVQADLRTFNALGVFGCSAITAITAQNPFGVSRIDAVPADGVSAQIAQVCGKIAVKGAKTGMLFSAEIVEAVAEAVTEFKLKLICDPVMVSTSGSPLLKEEAIDSVRKLLLPKAQWITPNIPEASLLLGKELKCAADYQNAAQELHQLFGANIFLKGGHDETMKNAEDWICHEGRLYTLTAPKLSLPPLTSHGTGCTLSSALAALTALDFGWEEMVCEAKAFVFGSLREHVEIGKGVHAMYPPVEDSLEQIRLKPVKK